MANKTIKFDYFQVYCRFADDEVAYRLFDLEPILERAREIEISERTYTYYDELSRLQEVYPMGDGLWGLRFIRIRPTMLPGIATEEGDFEFLNLEEGEYVGEEVTALYDPEYCVLMLQRNRLSLGPNGVVAYFNCAWRQPGQVIELRPIVLPINLGEFTREKLYRSLSINIADVRANEIRQPRSSLTRALRRLSEFEGFNVNIKVSLGPRGRRNDTLNQAEVINTIQELYEHTGVTKFELKKKDSADDTVETFDLIEQRLRSTASFTVSREEIIEHIRVLRVMEGLYRDTRERFETIIRPGDD